MKKYPKIGIRPTIDGRQGGVRENYESCQSSSRVNQQQPEER